MSVYAMINQEVGSALRSLAARVARETAIAASLELYHEGLITRNSVFQASAAYHWTGAHLSFTEHGKTVFAVQLRTVEGTHWYVKRGASSVAWFEERESLVQAMFAEKVLGDA